MTTQTKTEIQITIENEQAITTSRNVAENFGKQHKHVLEAIDELTEGLAENSANLFYESEYVHPQNKRTFREIYMTKDGFTLLAMGFTGKRALEFKLAYIEQFNKMEEAIRGVYHVSETALTNNVMNAIEDKLFHKIDKRLEKYEENYRPTQANKIAFNSYIKSGLGDEREPGEADLVKRRVLLMLDAENWQDVPYKRLIENMRLIDESIQAVKSFRTKQQLNLFESYF